MKRPQVPGIRVGQIAYSTHGRRMRILENDVMVRYSDVHAEGPYACLQALDDRNCTAIWPREWYSVPGQQLDIFAGAA